MFTIWEIFLSDYNHEGRQVYDTPTGAGATVLASFPAFFQT